MGSWSKIMVGLVSPILKEELLFTKSLKEMLQSRLSCWSIIPSARMSSAFSEMKSKERGCWVTLWIWIKSHALDSLNQISVVMLPLWKLMLRRSREDTSWMARKDGSEMQPMPTTSACGPETLKKTTTSNVLWSPKDPKDLQLPKLKISTVSEWSKMQTLIWKTSLFLTKTN